MPNNIVTIGIDPGAKGGIAVRYSPTSVIVNSMPDTPADICEIISNAQCFAISEHMAIKCYMEEVGGYIGGAGQPGSAMFSFGMGYGIIQGILIALKVPYELVRPQKWQLALSLGHVGTSSGNYKGLSPDEAKSERRRIAALNRIAKRHWKNKLKEHAQRLYPNLKVTLNTSDALLILEYARLRECGITTLQVQG